MLLSLNAAGAKGVPPQSVHVVTDPVPIGLNAKSLPQTFTPLLIGMTRAPEPFKLLPIATGAVSIVAIGPKGDDAGILCGRLAFPFATCLLLVLLTCFLVLTILLFIYFYANLPS